MRFAYSGPLRRPDRCGAANQERKAAPHGQEDRPPGRKPAGGPAGLFDSQLAATVRESAQQIWLAGMGAFAKAQAGGEKVF